MAVKVKVVSVTPDFAAKMLEKNTNNRQISEHVVARYAKDMKEGRWGVSESAICFDETGLQINGQHRLWAVLNSGVTVDMIIAEGYPVGAINYIDDTFARSGLAQYKIANGAATVTVKHMAVARLIGGAGSSLEGNKESRQVVFGYLDRYFEAIDFAVKAMPTNKQGITSAPVIVVIARAFYSADREKLKRFCEILCTGAYSTPSEKAVMLLREFLTLGDSNTRDIRKERYFKTERALAAFLKGEVLGRLYEAKEELFPLPPR